MAMPPDIVDRQLQYYLAVFESMNAITRLVEEHGITDGSGLLRDVDVLHSIIHKLVIAYENFSKINIADSGRFLSKHRVELTHLESSLEKQNQGIHGFQKLDANAFWQNHVIAARQEISRDIEANLRKCPEVKNAIEKKRSADQKPPLKFFSPDDYSHLKVVKKLSQAFHEQLLYVLGFVAIFSIRRRPITAAYLFKALKSLRGIEEAEARSIVDHLTQGNILKVIAESVLAVADDKIAENAAADFIESVDLTAVMKSLEGIDE